MLLYEFLGGMLFYKFLGEFHMIATWCTVYSYSNLCTGVYCSVIPVRDELEKCEYICSLLCTCIQLNVLCTGVQCYVSM